MFRCILCRESRDESSRSVEHVFPEAIGGTLTFREICKPCNDFLGHSADVSLVDHFLIKMDRRQFRLEGKSGIPMPFERGVLREREGQSKVRWEDNGYVYRHPSRRIVDGRNELWLDPRDAAKSEEIERRSRSREPRSGGPLSVRIGNATQTSGTLDFPVDTSMTSSARGLVKIAYETAVLLLGESYLESQNAECVRAFLRDTSADITKLQGKFVDGQVSGLAEARNSRLIAGVVPSGRQALSYVRIFNRCELVLLVPGDATGVVGPDGAAFLIEVAPPTQPIGTSFRDLGWFRSPG